MGDDVRFMRGTRSKIRALLEQLLERDSGSATLHPTAMITRAVVFFLLSIVLLVFFDTGCATQNASYFYTQKQIAEGDLNFDRRLRVDEYINAFPQEGLKRPQAGRDLAVSVDWMQTQIPKGSRTAIAQIAIRTRGLTPNERTKRMGISMVLDTSGSMMGENFNGAIEALREMVREFEDGTEFSLTTFSSNAQIVIEPVVMNSTTRPAVLSKIESLYPDGGTDIEAGLMKGYEAMSRFSKDSTSRLILLTDGRSNVGVTTPQEIAQKAGLNYIQGARISTIGLGHDVDEVLLRAIAEKAQGHYYFADSGKNLTRILRDELRTLMVPVAKDLVLSLAAQGGYKIKAVYGYDNLKPDSSGSIRIPFGELNVDDWRIVVTEVEWNATTPPEVAAFSAMVQYKPATPEVQKGKTRRLAAKSPVLNASNTKKGDLNPTVARNAVVFANAMALIQTSRLVKENRIADADRLLTLQLANTEAAASLDASKSLDREIDTLLAVRGQVRRALRNDSSEGKQRADLAEAELTQEARDKGTKSQVKAILRGAAQIADAVLPGPWGTIFSVFSSVLLAD